MEPKQKQKRVVRYTAAQNGEWGGGFPRAGWWYVIDLLTTKAAESDFKKGWFRKLETAQKAADKLNLTLAEMDRAYVKLSNGFVAVQS